MDVAVFDVQLVLPDLTVHWVDGVSVVLEDQTVWYSRDKVNVHVL